VTGQERLTLNGIFSRATCSCRVFVPHLLHITSALPRGTDNVLALTDVIVLQLTLPTTLISQQHSMSAKISELKPFGLKPVQHQHRETPRVDPFAFDRNDDRIHVLLCASGSVATIKIPNMINALAKHENVRIRLIFTTSAANFLQGQSAEQPSIADVEALPNVDAVYFDADEWAEPWVRGNKILHIELRRWADIMVIAPMSWRKLRRAGQITYFCPLCEHGTRLG
jgi:hypothetical protein